MRTLACLSLVACSGKDDTSPADTSATDTDIVGTAETGDTQTTEPQGACGDPVLYDLTVTGAVTNATGQAAASAHVLLEDRGWRPGTVLAEATTDLQGLFTLNVVGLTSLENCWGTVLDYVLEADLGTQYGEREINTPLFNAIQDGTLSADMTLFPLQMEEPTQ